ncbi:membrane protein [Leucobacter sp. Psy1]|uniref:NRAMP family divalent metal transporter n=1 Tax=Leucobacter sp. Psy1 TaxID=2875729 RepID=UPI001CD7A89C|nr:NRAMP family divalent metal transporter [Leucobacter sp. Psy1]UBH04927.1 membrane protein [Leucobacter sp. Psy1]
MSERNTAVPGPETVASGAVGFVRARRASLLGAIFMMATSAIGPGFITQTATFTATLGAAFAFGILVSIIIDFVVQANIWRIVTVSGRRAAELANAAVPFSGYVLAVLVIFGGLVFNIGNIAGAGLGLNALLGIDAKIGGAISAALAIVIFIVKRAGVVMDWVIVALGLVMIVLTVIVAIVANPPIGEALTQTVLPDVIDFAMITTIVGGTVGGYITYAGAHKLLDSGVAGVEHAEQVTRSAFTGIAVTGVMRYVLFLAFLGVTASGVTLDLAGNPAGDAFQAAAGEIGLRAFGLVLWAAGISSVIGAAFTSVSFTTVFSRRIDLRVRSWITVGFILVGLTVYLILGTTPVALLVFAGGFNGLILPIGFTIFMYIGWFRRDLLHGYRVPKWLLISGTIVTVLTWYMGVMSFSGIFAFLAA